jgi:hypothetical protein
VEVQVCTQEAEVGESQVEATLGYTRPVSRTKPNNTKQKQKQNILPIKNIYGRVTYLG